MNTTSHMLPPKEFVNQLVAILSEANNLPEAATRQFIEETERHGSPEGFSKNKPQLYNYLENVMHKAKDVRDRIEGIEYFFKDDDRKHFGPYEYLVQAQGTLAEARKRFVRLFESSAEYTMIDSQLKPDHKQFLEAMSQCEELAKSQLALAGVAMEGRSNAR